MTDVSSRADVRNLESHVRSTYGRCDVLINNAGFLGRNAFDGPAAVEETERVMATNFFGAVSCTAEFLGLLEASAPSHVVNVASVAGRIAVGVPAYTASKFALVGWTESLSLELPKKGIYPSSVEPGFIPTEGFQHEDLKRDRLTRSMLGTEADVSKAIQDAIAGRKVQRVVPRWYYLFQVPRVLAPRAYRFVATRLAGSRLRSKV